MKSACVIIPCRFASSRFHAKPLAILNNKPLMYYPYKAALKAKNVQDVFIATDNRKISKKCEELGMRFIMTKTNHQCGTDRVAEAFFKLRKKYDIIVNVQGDEPFIKSREIEKCVYIMRKNPKYLSVNGVAEIKNSSDIINSGVVKVILTKNSLIPYLSRSPVPYPHIKQIRFNYFRQLGLYGFRKEALEIFRKNKPGHLELFESIEILRLIENNIDLYSFKSKIDGPAIDTAGDLKTAQRILDAK